MFVSSAFIHGITTDKEFSNFYSFLLVICILCYDMQHQWWFCSWQVLMDSARGNNLMQCCKNEERRTESTHISNDRFMLICLINDSKTVISHSLTLSDSVTFLHSLHSCYTKLELHWWVTFYLPLPCMELSQFMYFQ